MKELVKPQTKESILTNVIETLCEGHDSCYCDGRHCRDDSADNSMDDEILF
jgi:hypothetical protein